MLQKSKNQSKNIIEQNGRILSLAFVDKKEFTDFLDFCLELIPCTPKAMHSRL